MLSSILVNAPSTHPLHRCGAKPGTEALIERTQKKLLLKYWEIIADNLHGARFSLGWVLVLDLQGQTIWTVDTHKGRFTSSRSI
jgi:hypothetical protein